jgi:hypothetical protein
MQFVVRRPRGLPTPDPNLYVPAGGREVVAGNWLNDRRFAFTIDEDSVAVDLNDVK